MGLTVVDPPYYEEKLKGATNAALRWRAYPARTLEMLCGKILGYCKAATNTKREWPDGIVFLSSSRKNSRIVVKNLLDVTGILEDLTRSPLVSPIMGGISPYDRAKEDPVQYTRQLRDQARLYHQQQLDSCLHPRSDNDRISYIWLPVPPPELVTPHRITDVLPSFDDRWVRAVKAWDAKTQKYLNDRDYRSSESRQQLRRKIARQAVKVVALAWLGCEGKGLDVRTYERYIRLKYRLPAPPFNVLDNSAFGIVF